MTIWLPESSALNIAIGSRLEALRGAGLRPGKSRLTLRNGGRLGCQATRASACRKWSVEREPITTSRGSPAANTITVGIESTS
jgi:hypothetical protein